MKCPRCQHSWKAARKLKARVSLPISETSPGTVFPQPCWKCERPLQPGEPAFASTIGPVSFCPECVQAANKTTARDLFPVSIESPDPLEHAAPEPAPAVEAA